MLLNSALSLLWEPMYSFQALLVSYGFSTVHSARFCDYVSITGFTLVNTVCSGRFCEFVVNAGSE